MYREEQGWAGEGYGRFASAFGVDDDDVYYSKGRRPREDEEGEECRFFTRTDMWVSIPTCGFTKFTNIFSNFWIRNRAKFLLRKKSFKTTSLPTLTVRIPQAEKYTLTLFSNFEACCVSLGGVECW